MKTKLILALLALVLIGGCNKEKPNTDDLPHLAGGWGTLEYVLALEVVDQNGNHILAGDQIVLIEGASAEVRHIEKALLLENKLHNHHRDGINYFVLCASDTGIVYLPDVEGDATLICKIKCKEVFGDQEIHTIESKWQATKLYPLQCKSFTFEEVTYRPDIKNGFMSAARVVINR